MNKSKNVKIVLRIVLAMLLLVAGPVYAAERDFYRLVVLGDPHLPGETLAKKEQVRETINGWADVDLVVAVGDITENVGDSAEYEKARAYFSAFTKPLALIGGNHDYLYEDWLNQKGNKVKACEATRIFKLGQFKKTFAMQDIYYTKRMGPYVLIFLTPDDLHASTLATISATQQKWLAATLAEHKDKPTVIFFHAPLPGTLSNYNQNANSENFVAQPHQEIGRILTANPQVFLWVSGHTHTPPTEPSFAAAVNRYEGRVMNLHNTDMKRVRMYTNSLFLYPDRVMIKTFDHEKGAWMDRLNRTIPVPSGNR